MKFCGERQFMLLVASLYICSIIIKHRRFWIEVPELPARDRPMKTKSLPLISFIIPSSLSRATLNRTIESLQKQSISNWEAIVGVDLLISKLTEEQVAPGSLIFKQDERVHFFPISTINDTNRGVRGNGAGGVRNHMIRDYATSNWVAFVDDDDTLSPDYIQHWESGRQHDKSADIIIFRMEARSVIPPLEYGSIAVKKKVGISYAVRKELFVRKQNGVAFVPHHFEDYNFLKQAQTYNAIILISDCVTYFVRKPPLSRNHTSCHFWDAIIADSLRIGQKALFSKASNRTKAPFTKSPKGTEGPFSSSSSSTKSSSYE
jgi:hypothetical protein